MGQEFPIDVAGAALLVGAIGVPLAIYVHREDRKELAGAEPSIVFILVILAFLGMAYASIFWEPMPDFLATVFLIFLFTFLGAQGAIFVIKTAPKVYWVIRYLIWKTTGFWPNRSDQ
ncbi:hypothetical protein [Sulfitobacter sp. 20_GPM-1509m]|uniref:hypothetical protein n=1 Tax=Sulfitobacter sp. 20_GPM-1509m TaxID=1380367 RepID=UPI00049125C5|nr:hypothetical protein [Sulfitobacter sp. 20_GPM-1509m]